MQAYTAGVARPKATEILSAPPRSGSFSVYSQKLTALAFVWLCAIVVWGNVANFASVSVSTVTTDACDARCGVQIGFAVLAWLYVSGLLILNYLTEKNSMSRNGCFSHGLEVQWIGFLVVLWIPVLVSTSTVGAAPVVATWFAWGGFFGAFYATYKAYHSFKEEDLPSALPDGFDEEDYVYG